MNNGTVPSPLQTEIGKILNKAQESVATHEKQLQLMKVLYAKSNKEDFFEKFIFLVKALLQQEFKVVNCFIDRALYFCARFSVYINDQNIRDGNEESEFLDDIFYFFLEVSSCVYDSVRFRSCQVINMLLDFSVGNDMDIDLCEFIIEAMINRLQDGVVDIRLQAVAALHHLQDPTDDQDPIIEAYTQHMLGDVNSKVRAACTQNIVLRRSIVPYFFKKLRDVDVKVRIAAFTKAAKMPHHFKIVERLEILTLGFQDNNSSIKEFVKEKLTSDWLTYYQCDYLKLLNSLRLDADKKDIALSIKGIDFMLSSLFKIRHHSELLSVLKYNDNHVIDYEDLNWETIIYWYYFIRYLQENPDYDEVLDQVLPDLVDFCKYIEKYHRKKSEMEMSTADQMEYEFILKYMFLILACYDFSDFATDQCFKEFSCHVLKKMELDRDVVQAIVRGLEKAILSIKDLTLVICELISEILDCENVENEKVNEINYEISRLKVKINCNQEEINTAVKERNYGKAAELQVESKELVLQLDILKEHLNRITMVEQKIIDKDVKTLIKCLDIAEALLVSLKLKELSPELNALKILTIEELLCHTDEEVRRKALRCYSLCCILNKQCAKLGIHILAAHILAYQTQQQCDVDMLLTAIGGVSDMLVIYGTSLVTSPDDIEESDSTNEQDVCVFKGGTSLTSIIRGLVDLMDDENAEIQERAGIGLCNLIVNQRVHSAHLICRMILKWCKPLADTSIESLRLCQGIGVMLEMLPNIPNTTDQIEDAVMLTIKTILRAPSRSPLRDVNLDNLIKFLLQLCRGYNTDFLNMHYNLALTICKEMQADPKSRKNFIYSRILLQLNLQKVDVIALTELREMYENLRDLITNQNIINNIIKFIALIQSLVEGFSMQEGNLPTVTEE